MTSALSGSVEDQVQLTIRAAVVLALATLVIWALPITPATLGWLKDLLLLAAFLLPLYALHSAYRDTSGSERYAWGLLFIGTIAGGVGQTAATLSRLAGSEEALLAEIGFGVWILVVALALALEVSSGGRGFRAELVVDLLLIGTIGLVLTREIFAYLAPLSAGIAPYELVVGGANFIAALALTVAALGVVMSPSALGGGVPRLLLVFAGFVAAVARMVHAYQLLWGVATPWLAPAWSFALLLMAAAGAERLQQSAAGETRAPGSDPSLLRTMVVPVIVAYALSLLIREILGAGDGASGNGGMAWAMLALLIVARVAVAILSSEKHAQEVAAWEQRYKTVARALGEVVYEWDTRTDKVVRSGNTQQVFGLSPDEAAETPEESFALMHPEDRVTAEQQIREAVERGGWFEIEYRVRHADGGYRLIRDRGFCLHDERQRPVRVLGLMADITDERDAEERLRRAERLASLGGLAAGAAHEINNPLAAVALAAQMLQEDDRLTDDMREDVDVIARQAKRAAEVTDRMLVFARRKEGVRSATDLNELADEVLRGRRYDLETHGIKVDQELSPDLPMVWIDPGQIERAILNLVVNAEHALMEVPEGERVLTVATKATKIGAAVDIIDSGPGIPPAILPRIFDPFFTTREVGEGTGLGLSMSYGLVQAHGGELRVETRPGATTFTVELPSEATAKRQWVEGGSPEPVESPRTAPAPRQGGAVGLATLSDVPGLEETGLSEDGDDERRWSATGPSSDDDADLRFEPAAPSAASAFATPTDSGRVRRRRAPSDERLRILVVDDEASVRGLARRFLEQQGHEVDEAESGTSALELLDDSDYDSIVLDLRMPDLSGEGLFEWLKRHRPELAERVTVISGDFANPETEKIISRMGRPYLYKPFSLDDLLRMVEG